MRLISVIIGANNSQTRFNECTKLFNYGFANFESKNIVDMSNPIINLPVSKGKIDNVDLYAKENYSVVVKKGDKSNLDLTIENPKKISAPAKHNDVVGKAIISDNGLVVKEIDLILKTDIEGLSLKDCFDKVVEAW